MEMSKYIYLDNNSTTQMDPRVFEEIKPLFLEAYGNAASNTHLLGWQARDAVEKSRELISKKINASYPNDIIFTSGATESINLSIKGVKPDQDKNHIITVRTEHKAVLDSCKTLEKKGVNVTYLDVNKDGSIDFDLLSKEINNSTYMISVMLANNETGVIQDLKAIGNICKNHGLFFHTDATQAVGKIPFDVKSIGVHMASFTAHKMYGPKGIGALYLDRVSLKNKLIAQIDGGGHEGGYRSGTLNVPGIVGFAKALDICTEIQHEEADRISKMRDMLFYYIRDNLDDVYLNGSVNNRLPGTLNLSIKFIDADSLLLEMKKVYAAAGSACTSAKKNPSHVLKAIGLSDEMANSSVRFSLGRFNTENEIAEAAQICVAAVKKLRSIMPPFFKK